MTELRFNDKPVKVPNSWHDFTVSMMQDTILNAKLNPELWKNMWFRLCVYTGFDFDEISNCKISDEQFAHVADLLSFERDELDMTAMMANIPNSIAFFNEEGKEFMKVRVPRKMDEERAGPKVMFMQEVNSYVDEHKDLLPVVHKAIAIYFQEHVMPGVNPMQPFDTAKVEQFEEVCKRCKFVEAFPVAAFFLTRSLNWTKRKKSN